MSRTVNKLYYFPFILCTSIYSMSNIENEYADLNPIPFINTNLLLQETSRSSPDNTQSAAGFKVAYLGGQYLNKIPGTGYLTNMLGYEWSLKQNSLFLSLEAGLGVSNIDNLFPFGFLQTNLGFYYYFDQKHGFLFNIGLKTNIQTRQLWCACGYLYQFTPSLRCSLGMFTEILNNTSTKIIPIQQINQDQIINLFNSSQNNSDILEKLYHNFNTNLKKSVPIVEDDCYLYLGKRKQYQSLMRDFGIPINTINTIYSPAFQKLAPYFNYLQDLVPKVHEKPYKKKFLAVLDELLTQYKISIYQSRSYSDSFYKESNLCVDTLEDKILMPNSQDNIYDFGLSKQNKQHLSNIIEQCLESLMACKKVTSKYKEPQTNQERVFIQSELERECLAAQLKSDIEQKNITLRNLSKDQLSCLYNFFSLQNPALTHNLLQEAESLDKNICIVYENHQDGQKELHQNEKSYPEYKKHVQQVRQKLLNKINKYQQKSFHHVTTLKEVIVLFKQQLNNYKNFVKFLDCNTNFKIFRKQESTNDILIQSLCHIELLTHLLKTVETLDPATPIENKPTPVDLLEINVTKKSLINNYGFFIRIEYKFLSDNNYALENEEVLSTLI